jgi:hypothetical protein
MLRARSLAILIWSGAAFLPTYVVGTEPAKTAVRPTAKRAATPASSVTITAPQRLTGFYHPHGVGVAPVAGTIVDGPAMMEPVAPMPAPLETANCGQPVCGCAAPFPTYAPPGLAYGGYSAFMNGPLDPHTLHFGSGYHRYGLMDGHVRYPYYSYRRPWYNPGSPSFNRDLYQPW